MFKAVCVDPKQRILVVIKPYFLARQETLEEIYHSKQEVEYYNYKHILATKIPKMISGNILIKDKLTDRKSSHCFYWDIVRLEIMTTLPPIKSILTVLLEQNSRQYQYMIKSYFLTVSYLEYFKRISTEIGQNKTSAQPTHNLREYHCWEVICP